LPDIFEAVQSGKVDRGVVPFENSTNGSVVFTLDLFADRDLSYPDISVCGEIYHDVHHYLLGHHTSPLYSTSNEPPTPPLDAANAQAPRARTAPLSSLRNIQRIYSHPQAFGQCELFLQEYLKGIERIDVSSTSKAAELVKVDTTGTSAAIASQVAAEIHALDVLAKGIEDRADNTTRFFILRKGMDDSMPPNSPASMPLDSTTTTTIRNNEDESDEGKNEKSLVSFTVHHQSPGALADVLDSFRRYRLNLTSINSRPSRITPFQYIFFVEFEGSRLRDPRGEVNGAFESLNRTAHSWRWLGSWEDKLRVQA
jgi:prephenate dehydratase